MERRLEEVPAAFAKFLEDINAKISDDKADSQLQTDRENQRS